MLHQGLAFKGFSIEASDGKIGTVSDFLFDETSWKLRWLVVDTGTWLADRKLLLHPSSIDRADIAVKTLLVNLTREQVEKSPLIATDEPVSLQMQEGLYSYYGVDPLWGGGFYGGQDMGLTPALSEGLTVNGAGAATKTHVEAAAASPGDPHLRSLVEVTGYKIDASDGAIGHVASFLVDDHGWEIRYLVADTANWWFGRHVLLSPACVVRISWETRKLSLNLTGYKIKGSPPWDSSGLLDRAYEKLLHAYYEWPARFLPATHALPAEAPADTASAPS